MGAYPLKVSILNTPENPTTDTSIVKVIADDTARIVTVDKALRTSEMRYRRLFEAAKDGILLLNAKTAQIEDVNPFLINMLGYSHEELLGKNYGKSELSKILPSAKKHLLNCKKIATFAMITYL